MSKENVLKFLSSAAEDQQLRQKLQSTASQNELVGVGKRAGYEFSSGHVDEAMAELKKQPGFFGALAEAVLEIFGPHSDDYPTVGVQPFSGDPNPK